MNFQAVASLLFFTLLCTVGRVTSQDHGMGLDFEDPSSVLDDISDSSDLQGQLLDMKPKVEHNPEVVHWKNRCREDHGAEVIELIEDAPGQLVTCVLQYVKPDKLQIEVNRSMARGNLDRVFKKYCGYRGNILACVDTMLDKFRTCMTAQQLQDVNITRRAVDAAIDFTCHDDGDRIALFMAEQGVECLKEHKDSMKQCAQQRVPDLQQSIDQPDSFSLDDIVINEQQCGKLNSLHQCIVQETTKCPDPTPANILDALITQMLKVTPCWNINKAAAEQTAAAAAAAHGEDGSVTSSATSNSDFIKTSIAGIGPILTGIIAGGGSTEVRLMQAAASLFLRTVLLGGLGYLLTYLLESTYLAKICQCFVYSLPVLLPCVYFLDDCWLAITGSNTRFLDRALSFMIPYISFFGVSMNLVLVMAGLTAAHLLI